MFRCIGVRSFPNLLLFTMLCLNAITSFAASTEIVWIDSQVDEKSVYFGSYQDEEWSISESPLYISKNPMTSLALGTDSQGHKILLWTELVQNKAILMSMQAKLDHNQNLTWSEATLFSDFGNENFAASIVFDGDGRRWVFWAATTKNYSDIVVLKPGSDDPLTVNEANEVPDTTPVATLQENGSILVEWSTYDYNSGAYILESKSFSDEFLRTKPSEVLVDSVIVTDIPLPPNVIIDHSALLHFPDNQLVQSKNITNAK